MFLQSSIDDPDKDPLHGREVIYCCKTVMPGIGHASNVSEYRDLIVAHASQ